jgi:crotonobetainyl-CoA:carnitine CoA-transferase CaiB-like acyl-CoA transferase
MAPLEGVKVLELGHIVAGPSAGLILADLGAEVIKIEQPGQGDAARNMPNFGSTFYFLNRNKRSLALDLKSAKGIEIFAELMKQSDVVVDNFAPHQLDKWGIGYEWASELNPKIIYCSIKGFLPGPNQSRPFLDELAQMAAGLAFMTGPVGQPLRAGASIIDIGAATYATLGILAALLERHSTNKGQMITTGLFETAVFWVGQHTTRTQLTGKVPEPMLARSMGGQMGWGVYQAFSTCDQRQIFIAVTSNKQWLGLCKALDLPELARDPTLQSNRQRVQAHDRITPIIAGAVSKLSYQETSRKLADENLAYGPINNPRDVLDDPHLSQSRFWMEITPDGETPLRVPKLPIHTQSDNFEVHSQPPQLGEHSREILLEIGHSEAEIEEWEHSGVIQINGGMLKVEERNTTGDFSQKSTDS